MELENWDGGMICIDVTQIGTDGSLL